MKIQYLSKREIKELNLKINSLWADIAIEPLKVVRSVEVEEGKYLLMNEAVLIKLNDILLPFVGDEKLCSHFPSITVDQGSIKYIINGANVMRPGIKMFEGNFIKDQVVVVKEEKHQKFIAVGVALIQREEAEKASKGAIVRNLHRIGDKFWEVYKSVTSS
ncbi:MAG: PUA domain-containing protein [Conexivisphaerales archaeon]